MPNNSPRTILPLLWIMLFDHASLNIAFPVLTLLFFDLHSSLFSIDTSHTVRSMWYGLCVAVPHIINIIMTPILSALSDELGRKRILLIGTAGAFLFAITAAFGVLLGSLSLLFVGRIIQGAFSRTNPIAQAAIGDMSSHNKKVVYMGYLQTAISLGAFIGPIIGGYFANQILFSTFNFSLPYFIAAIFAAISFFLTVSWFEETFPGRKRSTANVVSYSSDTPENAASITVKRLFAWRAWNFKTLKIIFTNKKVLSISAVLLSSQFSWSMYYQYIPPILKTELHFNAHSLGLFVGLIAFWLAIATTFGIKILDSLFSFRQILMGSLYLILFGLALTFLFCFIHVDGDSSILVWIAAIPTAIGDVIAYSCLTTLYSNAVDQHAQGKVMAVCFIVVSMMWALTGIAGGALMSLYGLLPLVIAPIGIVCAIVLLHSTLGKSLI